MKVLLIIGLFLSSSCFASSDLVKKKAEWLNTWIPVSVNIDVESGGLKFNGCKHKDYKIRLTQTVNSKLFLETSLGYSKGQLSWGAFSQKVSVKELSFIPRYKLSHILSIGAGVIAQSNVEFKSTQGVQLDLPKNTEWVINTRAKGFAQSHFWELAVSTQRWEATQATGSWFETGESNRKVGLSYNGYF